MGGVLPDRFWRARDRKECANADTDPGRLGGGGKNGLRTRRHGVLYCRRAGEGCQEPQRQYLPLSVGFAHRSVLGHAIIRFSGHPGTTADRAALCILIAHTSKSTVKILVMAPAAAILTACLRFLFNLTSGG